MTVSYEGQVAIVTGAGTGLGRSHALALAARGAKVVVNDLGTSTDGSGSSSAAGEAVVAEIRAAGGEAIANGANVSKVDEVEAMVQQAMDTWGRVDILINNAGILRDRSFTKMTHDDMHAVINVHLLGSMYCTKAVWEIMKAQNYGRIVMTTSPSGLYGNFGQANYSAAKLALVGLMFTLVQEGQKYDIRVNAMAPTAGTRMTEGLIDDEAFKLFTPESISAGVLALAAKDAPNRMIMSAGAGGYSSVHLFETHGVFLPPDQQTPDAVLASMEGIKAQSGMEEFTQGFQQGSKFTGMAADYLKNK